MRSLIIASIVGVLTLILFVAAGRAGQADHAKVAVWVEIPRPSEATDERLTAEFAGMLPTHAQVHGLERKYFTFTNEAFGGIYLWRDEDAAKAFFTTAWHSRILQTYGRDARLVWFDVPATTIGSSSAQPSRSNVVAIVQIKAPWYAPQWLISSRFNKAIPTYAALPNLIFKYFTLGPDRTFGGIYLWDDQSSANAFFNAAWYDRVKDSYGQDGKVIFLKAPVSLINSDSTPHDPSK